MNYLPKIKLLNEDFFIDLRLRELRAVNNPSNRITESDMKDEGDFYLITLDDRTNAVPTSTMWEYGSEESKHMIQYAVYPDIFSHELISNFHHVRVTPIKMRQHYVK